MLASVTAALGAAALPAAAAAAPTVEAVLPGGVGDGGPAAEALVNARRLHRTATGDLWFFDTLQRSWRPVSAATGMIAELSPTSVPPLPAEHGKPEAILDAWVTPSGVLYWVGGAN